jgi:hypothetical protein
MRAPARATATVPRHVLEQGRPAPPAATAAAAAAPLLEELAVILDRALASVNELRARERTPAAAA